jgi:hypothetical protein
MNGNEINDSADLGGLICADYVRRLVGAAFRRFVEETVPAPFEPFGDEKVRYLKPVLLGTRTNPESH